MRRSPRRSIRASGCRTAASAITIRGSNRPIRDDVLDTNPHGTLDMEHAVMVSCNAYFAQLGTYNVGAQPLFDTASLLGIAVASPNKPEQLRKSLPQSSYGQGQVVASPFQMARVAATVANGGMMPAGRWVTDESNDRADGAEAGAEPGCGGHDREVHARGGDRRHGQARGRRRSRRSRARPAQPSWRRRRRTPGSSDSRRTAAARRSASLFRF